MLRRQDSVMDGVEFGLMRRMEIGRVELPVTDRSGDGILIDLPWTQDPSSIVYVDSMI
jgi:hypothetical protein